MLVVLSSTQVTHLTQISATLFSMAIIGSGAPVFCVIIHSILLGDGHFSPRTSLFLGSIAPYLVATLMYQGHLLMDILNWAGLVVNGMVASILPLVLAFVAYRNRLDENRLDDKSEAASLCNPNRMRCWIMFDRKLNTWDYSVQLGFILEQL